MAPNAYQRTSVASKNGAHLASVRISFTILTATERSALRLTRKEDIRYTAQPGFCFWALNVSDCLLASRWCCGMGTSIRSAGTVPYLTVLGTSFSTLRVCSSISSCLDSAYFSDHFCTARSRSLLVVSGKDKKVSRKVMCFC